MSHNLGIGALHQIDNRDDRREVFYLLSQLTQSERTQFLNYCVRCINQGIMARHQPPWILCTAWSDTGTLEETYFDLMGACAKYMLPIDAVVRDLEIYVTKLQKLPTEYQRLLHEKSFNALSEHGVKKLILE